MDIEQFKQLFPLPENWVFSKVLLILFGFVPFVVKSLLPFTRLWSALSEARNQKILMDQLSRGSYDKETIQQSTKYYIIPKCSNIDPAQEEEVRQALMATKESLFDKIDYFIDHGSSKRHLLVLADSGTGKTSFLLNYYAYNLRQRGKKSQNLLLVYLGLKDADDRIQEHENKSETIIFLDALDEDTKAIENHLLRIRELMEICREYKRVVITCRTQFFPSDEEVPVETGIARIGPRKAGEKGIYEFWKLYLSPFDDSDINLYLQRRFPIWQLGDRKKAKELAYQVKSLSARPMLLAHITDVAKSNASITQSCQLYQLMVDAWLERESSWVKKDFLKEYSERLSVNLYVCREKRGMERIPYNDLIQLADNWNINLPQWQLSGRSLLNRDAQGNYKFAHRSIMEFLFINRLLQRDIDCCGISLTDQMKSFLIERILPEDVNRDLQTAFKFLLKNEVYVNYEEKIPSDIAKDSNIDADFSDNENGDVSSSIKAFLENLHTASFCAVLFSGGYLPQIIDLMKNDKYRRLREEFVISLTVEGSDISLTDEGLDISVKFNEQDISVTIKLENNAFIRELLELAFRSLPPLTYDANVHILGHDFLAARSRSLFIDSQKVSTVSIGSTKEKKALVSYSLLPSKMHEDVKRFIKIYGTQGLTSYYLINNSGLCVIRPKLPSLDQFELILNPEDISKPARFANNPQQNDY